MIRKTLTSVVLAAGCAVALALPVVQAQTVDTQILMNAPRVNPGDRADWMAGRNSAESAQYDRLLEVNRAYGQSRILKECGPITNAHLRAGCFDSFSTSEDQPSPGWNEGLTGGSSGMMNSIGPTPYSPNMPIPDAGR
jgi:hypothetical protein